MDMYEWVIKMPYVNDKLCGKIKVPSKVRVGKVGSARWRSYCARTLPIGGSRCSKNQVQRRRWKC